MKASQNRPDASSLNSATQLGATTQHTTNNREELKMKMLLTGSYDYIHRETGKMIQKKLCKKAFGLLEKFQQQRKDLEMAEVIQLNRRIVSCVNKILKTHLTKPELEWESEEVLINMVIRGNQALFEIYKFLNIFIQKILPSEANFLMLEDVSHLSEPQTEDQNQIKQQKPTTLNQMINQYDKSPNPKNYAKDHNESYSDRVAEMIQRSEKLLNIQFELEQLWYNTVELMLKSALIYKQSGKAKLTYFYLYEAERICHSLVHSANAQLINLCARSKIMYANFLLETEQYQKALQQTDKALVILSGEFRLRMNSEKYVTKFKLNKEKKRQKKCAKTILSAMMTTVVIYESTGQFHEMHEALQTASWFGEKFVLGIDELKKHVFKTAQEGKSILEAFLHDVADLSYIAEYALEQELFDLKKRIRESQPSNQQEHMKQFNEDMYKLFQFKDLNEQQFYVVKNEVKQEIIPTQQNFFDRHKTTDALSLKNDTHHTQVFKQANQQDSQVQPNMVTDISMNILNTNSDTEQESFFDASFFAPSSDNYIFDSKEFDKKKLTKNQLRKKKPIVRQEEQKENPLNKNKLMKPNKSVGIIKIGGERAIDHRSDILTTNQYFKPMPKQIQLVNPAKLIETPTVNFKKVLDNLEYRQHPETMAHNKQDLDVYIKKIVQDKIGFGEFHNFTDIEPLLFMQRKQEDFDKKEFGFGRKMLNLKKKEALMSHQDFQLKIAVKVEIQTKVKNEAFVIDSRINIEQEVRELKKRKIDRFVADKRSEPQKVNQQSRDADETTYLKKALEKSKKKKLKDLIYKYQQPLGLVKFFIHLQREQNQEKHQKHNKDNEEEVKERPKSAIKQLQQQKQSQQQSPRHKSTKKNVRYAEDDNLQRSPKRSAKKEKQTFTEMVVVEQQSDAKIKEQLEKNQKKAHNVISLIIDETEKKIDLERRLLKKLAYQKKVGEKARYIDEDEKTYLKFTGEQNDLGRSTHLLRIKRELSEKQFTFEEIVMMRYQMKKNQSSGNLESSKSIIMKK